MAPRRERPTASWLTSLSTLWILAAAVLVMSVAGIAATVLLGRLPARVRDAIAGASVSGAAGLFAILTGFLIADEYGTLRELQRTVANEAAAMSALAYTSAVFPPADATLLQERLARDGEAVTTSEWPALVGEAHSEPSLITALGADLGELYASGPECSF